MHRLLPLRQISRPRPPRAPRKCRPHLRNYAAATAVCREEQPGAFPVDLVFLPIATEPIPSMQCGRRTELRNLLKLSFTFVFRGHDYLTASIVTMYCDLCSTLLSAGPEDEAAVKVTAL